MADTPKITGNIEDFYNAFNKLGPDERLYFIAEIDKMLAKKSEQEKKLFKSLIKSVREGKAYEQALLDMKKV
jgi:hypothetical protein